MASASQLAANLAAQPAPLNRFQPALSVFAAGCSVFCLGCPSVSQSVCCTGGDLSGNTFSTFLARRLRTLHHHQPAPPKHRSHHSYDCSALCCDCPSAQSLVARPIVLPGFPVSPTPPSLPPLLSSHTKSTPVARHNAGATTTFPQASLPPTDIHSIARPLLSVSSSLRSSC